MGPLGWRFSTSDDAAEDTAAEGVTPDPIGGFKHLRELYFSVDPEYKGRFTVPTLFDKKQGKIVSNESSEIIRMFYTEVRVSTNTAVTSINMTTTI